MAARRDLDHQPVPGVPPEKSARDRLIGPALSHPAWALGFEDEGWCRLARPALYAWAAADRPLRLVEQAVAKDDPDPRALACYGLLLRAPRPGAACGDRIWLRFVDGRPVSGVTTRFLDWCCARLAGEGKTALLLVWDNAARRLSREVRTWIRAHNRAVKATGRGVRIVACFLPTKSPWLNAIEPRWVHGRRRVVEPARRPARRVPAMPAVAPSAQQVRRALAHLHDLPFAQTHPVGGLAGKALRDALVGVVDGFGASVGAQLPGDQQAVILDDHGFHRDTDCLHLPRRGSTLDRSA